MIKNPKNNPYIVLRSKIINALGIHKVDESNIKKYKNYILKINHFFEFLYQDSPLRWFDIEKLREDQFVRLVVLFVTRNKEYNNIYGDIEETSTLIDYIGLIRDHDDTVISQMYIDSPNVSQMEKIDFNEIFLSLYGTVKINNKIDNIGYKDIINKIKVLNDDIYNMLLKEKEQMLENKIDEQYIRYVELYQSFVDDVVLSSIIYLMLYYVRLINPTDDFINHYNVVVKKMIEKCEKIEEEINARISRIISQKKSVEDVNLYLVRFAYLMQRKAIYDEYESIEAGLVKEIRDNNKYFKAENVYKRAYDYQQWLIKSPTKSKDFQRKIRRFVIGDNLGKKRIRDREMKMKIVDDILSESQSKLRYRIYDITPNAFLILYRELFEIKSKFDILNITCDKVIKNLKEKYFYFVDEPMIELEICDEEIDVEIDDSDKESYPIDDLKYYCMYYSADKLEIFLCNNPEIENPQERYYTEYDPTLYAFLSDNMKTKLKEIYKMKKKTPFMMNEYDFDDRFEELMKHTNQEIRFIESKYIRGYLNSCAVSSAYEDCCKLRQIIRNMLLRTYSVINDIEIFDLIHYICNEYLELLFFD